MKNWTEYKKKELLTLPKRKWDKPEEYRALLLVNTRLKHDSGYNLFAVIGCKDASIPTEIVGYMDDFYSLELLPEFHIDASMHGVFRLHSLGRGLYMFKVGVNCSSTDFCVGSIIERSGE